MMLSKAERAACMTSFAAYLTEAARDAGYDINSPRGGGRTLLAKESAMSPASIGRILAGQSLPDPYCLEALADALQVPYWEIFEEAGVVLRGTLRPRESTPKITTDSAAKAFGITRPEAVQAFRAMVLALQDGEPKAG